MIIKNTNLTAIYNIDPSLICLDLGSRAPRYAIGSWLAKGAGGAKWAVVDDKDGRVWALRPTRTGAMRIVSHHRRKYCTATNHYAKNPRVVPIDRDWLLSQSKRITIA